MSSEKVYKIIIAVITCVSTIVGIIFATGCSGMQFECKGSYCVKKV